MIDCKERELYAVINAQLVKNVADVMLHGLLTNGAFPGNIGVGVARHNHSHNITLAWSQSKIFWTARYRIRVRRALERLNEIGHPFRVDPVLPFHHLPNCIEQHSRCRLFQYDPMHPEPDRTNDFFRSDGRGK